VADGWCWFVLREEYYWLVAGGWFVLRGKYCWLVADKPSEQGLHVRLTTILVSEGCNRICTTSNNVGHKVVMVVIHLE
jgi:hypothetical protein